MIDVDGFMKEYGPPNEVEKADKKLLDAYRGLVPDQMLEFWDRFGFASYSQGLRWVVNPKQLDDVSTEWVPPKGKEPRAVPVIRTAFGMIIYWHKAEFTLLDPHHNDCTEAGDDVEVIFDVFLVGENARLGILRESPFKKALKKFGRLHRDEMYGYKLPLVMGGADDLNNMAKMKMREQLSILAQAHK